MGLPVRRVAEMLELVSLTETEADRRVANYSLGMRQRLGIATALIGDPAVLILDEPANGLDPAGIRWMRNLLRDYADRGGTVLLSSHLLHEIEVIADDIVMIGKGRIVCQGSKTNLLRTAGTVARAPDMHALQRALDASGAGTTVSGDGALRTDADSTRVGRVALVDGNVHQIDRIQAEAKARNANVAVICDLVHVVEYLSAPRGARLYPPLSGERLEGISLGPMAYLALKKKGDRSMPLNQRSCPGVWGGALGDPRDKAKARLPES